MNYFTKADLDPYKELMIGYLAYYAPSKGEQLIELEELDIEKITETILVGSEHHSVEVEGKTQEYDTVHLVPITQIVQINFYRDQDLLTP